MDLRATMMLADHVQVADGKLFVSGGGWTWILVGAPFGVGLLIEVPWDRLNEKHKLRLELFDADGQSVMRPTTEGDQAVFVDGEFVGGRPADLKPGTPMTMPMACNFFGVPLQPEQRYRWELSINGESREDWTLSFATRPAPLQAQAQLG